VLSEVDPQITQINGRKKAQKSQGENFVLHNCCTILGGAGAWIIGKSAPKLWLVDRPKERSSHVMPMPKGGGIGILVVLFVFIGARNPRKPLAPRNLPCPPLFFHFAA